MDVVKKARRRFLKESAALAGLAFGGVSLPTAHAAEVDESVVPVRGYGERSAFVTSVRTLRPEAEIRNSGPEAQIRNPIQEQTGIITPSPLHYVLSHGGVTPN